MPHSYEVEIGLRQPTEAAFTLEPLVKEERLIVRQRRRDVVMMERKGPLVTLRNDNGERENHKNPVLGGLELPQLMAVIALAAIIVAGMAVRVVHLALRKGDQ